MTPKATHGWVRIAAFSVAVAFALALSGTALAAKEQTVTGVVKPLEIARGEVRQCYLQTEDGHKLLVLNSRVGKELLTQTKSTIRATGYIRKPKSDKSFEKVIDIVSYEVVDPTAEKTAPPTENEAKPESDSE